MLAPFGEVDGLLRGCHGLEFVHVPADGIHQDFACEDRVLRRAALWSWPDAARLMPMRAAATVPIIRLGSPRWPRACVRKTHHLAPPLGGRDHSIFSQTDIW